jgi:hypothetical protein
MRQEFRLVCWRALGWIRVEGMGALGDMGKQKD